MVGHLYSLQDSMSHIFHHIPQISYTALQNYSLTLSNIKIIFDFCDKSIYLSQHA